jgi:hypothetical protein
MSRQRAEGSGQQSVNRARFGGPLAVLAACRLLPAARRSFPRLVLLVAGAVVIGDVPGARAGELTVDLSTAQPVSFVGAIRRWDADGKSLAPVDPKAKIDEPRIDARGVSLGGGRWVFRGLPPGSYDLVVLASGRVRVEGFRYPPITEFDPFLPPDAKPPDEETGEAIVKHIARSPQYENRVVPLFLAGDNKQVRILVQLVRDKPTSFDVDAGAPIATVRHEVWQYANQYGGWVKDRRTEVLDRVLLPRSEFHRWSWVWDPRLGGIEMADRPVTWNCPLPARFDPEKDRGWFPDRGTAPSAPISVSRPGS